MSHTAVPLEHRPVLKSAAAGLAGEVEGTFSAETIGLFLTTGYAQFAGEANDRRARDEVGRRRSAPCL